MATVGISVAVWVFMVISITKISAECGNTENDFQALATRVQACGAITEASANLTNINIRQLNEACSNIECQLSCIEGAIGNCDTTNDFYVGFNKQSARAESRGICADTTATINAITGCPDAMDTADGCKISVEQEMEQHRESGDGALYKQTACSELASVTSCMHVSSAGSCTSTYADFMNTFLKATVTYPICGHPTTNPWFQDHSGPVTCGVSGVAPSTLFLAAMACFVALIKCMHT